MSCRYIMILLIIGITSGCCRDQVVVQPPPVVKCTAPDRPELLVAKEYDRRIFFKNFNMVIEYSRTLEATVDCYVEGLKGEATKSDSAAAKSK